MPSLEFFTVDAFTRTPFTGNPAAVIVFPASGSPHSQDLSDADLVRIAAEFNLSETAFAWRLEDGPSFVPRYSLRWFTPTEEVPLCGHATLATSHVLFTHVHSDATRIEYETKFRGTLSATIDRSSAASSSSSSSISLDFPSASSVTLESGHRRRDKIVERVAHAVKGASDPGVVERVAWADQVPACVVELSSQVKLEGMEIDPTSLGGIGDLVILTQLAPSDSPHDIHSRVFAPDIGVPEDPVTGAAHTALAPFWLLHPSSPFSEAKATVNDDRRVSELRAKQVSPRGGEMHVRFDAETKRVVLTGHAREMMKGTLDL
ncbi:hypothetical protein JCM10212_006643 [Sporobolomyces blumeae]